MDPLLARTLVVLGVLTIIALVGFLLHRRHQKTWQPRAGRMRREDLDEDPHPLALVVFTSRFCMACKETLRTCKETAPEIPLVEIRLNERPEVAEHYGLVETPTLLLVDEHLRIRYTALGAVDDEELWLYVREAWDSSSLARSVQKERRRPKTP
jgi:glutaredoxin